VTEGAAPVENIGPRQARLRRVVGVVALVLSGAAYAWLVGSGAPRAARLALFVPLFLGVAGVLQAGRGVCMANAMSGTCDLDEGRATVTDPGQAAALRRAARSIAAKSAAVAAALTAVAYLVPI
jgi:hypothetical protein